MIEDINKILLESKSPLCPLSVIVEENARSTYMYLIDENEINSENSNSIIIAAWVRNHVDDRSSALEQAAMEDGSPPILPGKLCNHPEGKQRLKPEDIECIWFEDSNGVALLEKGEILCIIPSWARGEFPAYSSDCIKENSLAVPLKQDNLLIDVVRKAEEFKEFVLNKECLKQFFDKKYELLESYLGEWKGRYASENDGTIVARIFRFEKGGTTYLMTASMSLHMQPTVELCVDSPEDFRRIEIGFAIKTDLFARNERVIIDMLSYVALQPWCHITWIGHGHTIECIDGFVDVFAPDKSFGVFIDAQEAHSLPHIQFLDFRGDPVNLLWIVPISQQECDIVREAGVEELLKKFRKNKRSFTFNGTDTNKKIRKMGRLIQGLFGK